MADQKFKTKVRLQGGASLPAETASRAPIIDGSGNLVSSAVTSTELGYISGLTSSAQTQITDAQTDATQALSDAGAAQADATQALSDAADAQTTIDDHIADAVGAHAATAISNTPAGSIAATTVQAAIDEIDGDVTAAQTDIADLVTLSGVAANSTTLGTFTGTTIPDSSTVKAAFQSLESFIEALPDPMEYKGNYNATTNSPSLADGAGNNGDVYYVSVAGTQDFGSGNITFAVSDRVVYSGADAVWQKWDTTDSVLSVFGRTGAVVSANGDYTASQVTNVPAGSIAATTVQAAIDELESDVVAAQADATQALSDAADAQTDIDNHIGDTTDAHDASAISNTPSGNLAATDVQAALNELQGDIDALPVSSAGDISETSFSAANNQSSAADVTGLAFAAGVTRGFKALVSVAIDATADTYETFELVGINKSGSFDMAVSAVGDDTGVVFTITSAGQVQYTSANSAGFVTNTIKFRAQTTTV